MQKRTIITFLKILKIVWIVCFFAGCGFLIYSIYNKNQSGIIFMIFYLIFIAFAIKMVVKYTKKYNAEQM
tara:strand:+ start:106 stop:315 length:210 start_codon:yes stop_codon:yes gene_type:complete